LRIISAGHVITPRSFCLIHIEIIGANIDLLQVRVCPQKIPLLRLSFWNKKMISHKAILYASTTFIFIKAENILTLKTGLFHSEI